MAHVLFIRPCHDVETRKLVSWSNEVIDRLDMSDGLATFTDLLGNDVTEFNVLAALDDYVSLVVFHGHGGDSYLVSRRRDGLREMAITIKTLTRGLLRDKIIYALACNSARKLGRLSVQTGAKAYVGYAGLVSLTLGETERDFFVAASRFILTLSMKTLSRSRTSCGDAFAALKAAHEDIVTFYQSGRGVQSFNRAFYLANAEDNLESLVLLGDYNATI